MQKIVSLIILTYNSRRHLEALLQSIQKQTYPAIELIVVDNASRDETVSYLRGQTIRSVDQLIVNPENYWFAKGNNIGIAASHGDYVYICNDDVVLDSNCIARLVAVFERKPQCAMVGPKVLKLIDGQPAQIFDSAGLQRRRSGKVVNRGENLADQGQYNTSEAIFGITGAAMLLRRSALERARYQNEYFDDDYVAYKEDVDISWRLQRLGYEVYYEPTAIAYHARTMQKNSLEQRGRTRNIIRAYSFRNHWWTLIKNLSLKDLFINGIWLIPYECAKLAFVFVREWSTLAILPQCLRGIPRMWCKRRYYASL
ncbi:MAG: Glycosyl transferase [uncultured bacterium]|nr:MAG: Glycosyl transferase [uncultured bacterium]